MLVPMVHNTGADERWHYHSQDSFGAFGELYVVSTDYPDSRDSIAPKVHADDDDDDGHAAVAVALFLPLRLLPSSWRTMCVDFHMVCPHSRQCML